MNATVEQHFSELEMRYVEATNALQLQGSLILELQVTRVAEASAASTRRLGTALKRLYYATRCKCDWPL